MDELRKGYAILLSGGTGSRMKKGIDCPKQYAMVNNKPVFLYSLMTLNNCERIKGIIIVAEEVWRDFIIEYLEVYKIDKVIGFAQPGNTRQESIFSGLTQLNEIAMEQDIVLIHDAARPMLKEELINKCIDTNKNCDGVLPCISVKDTVYESLDGKSVFNLLQRSKLYAGQAPESFLFGKYYMAHLQCKPEEIATFSGSTEIAIKKGMNVQIIEGDEQNFKITTMEDYYRFVELQKGI